MFSQSALEGRVHVTRGIMRVRYFHLELSRSSTASFSALGGSRFPTRSSYLIRWWLPVGPPKVGFELVSNTRLIRILRLFGGTLLLVAGHHHSHGEAWCSSLGATAIEGWGIPNIKSTLNHRYELLLDHYGARYPGIAYLALIWQQISARGTLELGHAKNDAIIGCS
ncbi:hypothetical protein DEU56DRAFT_237710 [Suillus clintonianus]|uniref:uncharacterized protein n=1 Tax=Suillus clintonianus TaxID=1904413 RepID=UPI001B868CEE|nr:uncharacterized protein DEU56DRAFT_237710 [Suillus clintonianus]KAG2144290.1 hypothetical protein DEU56DRAFT_237710 [Suillus clintonianus]